MMYLITDIDPEIKPWIIAIQDSSHLPDGKYALMEYYSANLYLPYEACKILVHPVDKDGNIQNEAIASIVYEWEAPFTTKNPLLECPPSKIANGSLTIFKELLRTQKKVCDNRFLNNSKRAQQYFDKITKAS
jgi:hypothetical protein